MGRGLLPCCGAFELFFFVMDASKSRGELVGFKRAYLVFRMTADRQVAGVMFRGYSAMRSYYGVDARAVCFDGGDHEVPDESCTCGFYALKDRDRVARFSFSGASMLDQNGSVLLDVRLYGGRVLEGSHGFRGARQQVLSVTLPGVCMMCGAAATKVIAGKIVAQVGDETWRRGEVLCDACVKQWAPEAVVSAADVAGMLGTDVRFDSEVQGSIRYVRKVGSDTAGSVSMPRVGLVSVLAEPKTGSRVVSGLSVLAAAAFAAAAIVVSFVVASF